MITLPAGRPGEASGAVAALIALITPLPYSSDFRPFFTIHDPAFNDMAAQSLPSSSNSLPWLLGVTNLYIIKVLSEMLGLEAAQVSTHGPCCSMQCPLILPLHLSRGRGSC